MTQQVAFLRAVNLGKRRVDMAGLASLTRELGHGVEPQDVWTHVNSGNVVFTGTGSRATLEKAFETALEERYGFEVTTFVRTLAEVKASLDAAPFDLGEGHTWFVTYLKDAPTAQQKTALEALSGDFDTLQVHGRDVHWHMRGKSTGSALVKRDWEKVLGPLSSTSRNTTMLRGLLAKAGKRG